MCNFSVRIKQKINHIIFGAFGFDAVSSTKIVERGDLKRLGSRYGGWVVPSSLLSKDSICYCAGCGEDISFDLELIEVYKCNVFAFDPTPRSAEYVLTNTIDNSKYHFCKLGLWNKRARLKFYAPKNINHVSHSLLNLQKTKGSIQVEVDSLKNIMKRNGHTYLDLLKLDIEGAEYKVLNSISSNNIDIKVLCVEFDEMFNPLDEGYIQRINDSINKLTKFGYIMVFNEGNGNYTFVKE